MYLKKMLADAIKDIEHQLHPKAKEAIEDVLTYTNNFDRCTMHFGVTEFFSKAVHVVFGVVTEEDDKEELDEVKLFDRTIEEDVKNSQFATHQENVKYCGDTKKLLGILTKYCYDKGDGYWIYAKPDAWYHVDGKATLDLADEHTWRGKERMVSVYVRSSQYCMLFNFKEKIS